MGILLKVLRWVGLIVGVLPPLIHGAEQAHADKPKQGTAKWIWVEQMAASLIEGATADIAAEAPGTDPGKISAAISVFTKAVNDAIVALYNAVGIFRHTV